MIEQNHSFHAYILFLKIRQKKLRTVVLLTVIYYEAHLIYSINLTKGT